MNHDEAITFLDELGERVPDRRPPVGDLIRGGRLAKRRRVRRDTGIVALGVALLVAGGVAVQQWASEEDAAIDRNVANQPGEPSSALVPPGEAPAGTGPCPPVPASKSVDPTTVPAPDDAKGLTANASGTVAAWFEPASAGSLPFLVVHDIAAGRELAREDVGPGEDGRSSSLRLDEDSLFYRSAADADVWLRYRWGVDDYPAVYVVCE